MKRRLFVAVGLLVLVAVIPVLGYQNNNTAAPPVAPPPPVVEEDILTALNKRVKFEEIPANVPLREILDNLTKQFNLQFVVSDEIFKSHGIEGVLERKPNVQQKLDRFRLSQFLKLTLEGCQSGYIVRPDYVEIVPIVAVHNLFVPQAVTTDDGLFVRYDLPVVNMKFQQTDLEEAVRRMADANAVTVVFSAKVPQEVRATKVTERLVNVPFDTAVELLAAKADLVVVRKDTTFKIVTRPEQPEKPKAVPADPGRGRGA